MFHSANCPPSQAAVVDRLVLVMTMLMLITMAVMLMILIIMMLMLLMMLMMLMLMLLMMLMTRNCWARSSSAGAATEERQKGQLAD